MQENEYKPFTFDLASAIRSDEQQAEKAFAKVIAGLKTEQEASE